MFYVIIKNIKKDDYIVDKNSIMIVINFQRPVYKALYIGKRIRESYKDHLRTFHSSLTDEGKSIVVIKIYGQLKEEVKYIDHYNISFSADRINDILLKK